MKITIQDCLHGEEEEIIIKCRELDEATMRVIRMLKAGQDKMTVFKDEKLFQISPKEVYYFESVDNHVYVYLDREVYETRMKLYELEEMLEGTDFLRASKAVILNLDKVESLSPGFNGRFEARMKNGERTGISRQYVPDLKKKLGIGRQEEG